MTRADRAMHTALSRRGTPGGGVGPGCRARPGTEVSGATLRASAILLAALVRAVILIEALDHAEAAMHTAVVAADLNRPLLAPPAIENIRADGSARLLAEQRAVLCPDPVRALALL